MGVIDLQRKIRYNKAEVITMEKTMTLNLRVNPTVKQQAEDVLKQLGIPMATAIDMYLRQITLTGGIPFSLSLPKAPAALNADTMTDGQLHAALQVGIKEIQNGDTAVSYTHLDVYKRQQEYLPAPSNIRLADLMKEHNISQPELAKELGCSKSTISRFISGAKGTLTHEQVLKIARLFNVSTDFLLGETNIPDRKNYDIAELGLSVEAARNLYTGRVNAEVINLLLENARFAELTYRISQYFDDTFASGIAAQNAMLTTLSTLLRTKVKTPEAAKAAKDISLRRKPVYQGDLDDIEMYFMAAVKEIKKGIGSHYAEQEAMSKKVAEKMFNELTKGQDVQHPTITAEQLTDAMLDSVSGMEGATPEALEQLRSGLLGILQSAAEQENAQDRKSTRLNSSHSGESRMPSSA